MEHGIVGKPQSLWEFFRPSESLQISPGRWGNGAYGYELAAFFR